MRFLPTLLLLCLVFLLPTPSSSIAAAAPAITETGVPFMRNYLPQEYASENANWCVIQDNRGVVYAGNTDGLLEYDGVRWRLIQLPNRSTVRSLAKDRRGRILVGGQRDFGYLGQDRQGDTRFVSLLEHIPENCRNFADVWDICPRNGELFFLTQNYVFRFTEDFSKVEVIKATTTYHRLLALSGRIFARQVDHGLSEWKAGRWQMVPGGETFAKTRIYVALPWNNPPGSLLLGTRESGLMILDDKGLRPWDCPMGRELTKQMMYGAARLPDGTFAITTLQGGVYRMGEKGEFLGLINSRTSGLASNYASAAAHDAQSGLWISTAKGLARAEWVSPLSRFTDISGLPGNITALCRFDGRIYAGSNQGAYVMDSAASMDAIQPARFKHVKGTSIQCWNFLPLENSLLLASTLGIFEIRKDTAKCLIKGNLSAFCIHQSKKNPQHFFTGWLDGLGLMRHEKGRWIDEGRIPGVNVAIRELWEREDGSLWLATEQDGIYRLTFPEGWPKGSGTVRIEKFGLAHGLPHLRENFLFPLSGQPIFTTANGLYSFDESLRRFLPDRRFANLFREGSRRVRRLHEGLNGILWMDCYDESQNRYGLGMARPDGKGGYTWIDAPFRRFSDAATWAIWPDRDGVVWFGGAEGVIRYDPGITKSYAQSLPVIIRRVEKAGNVCIQGGGVPEGAGIHQVPRLPYHEGSLRFEYALPAYDRPEANRYKIYLEGRDKAWSPWTSEAYKEYTNLPEGDYRFRVRGMNVYGQESADALYRFIILRPWYRTWWAYLGYLLAFIAAISAWMRHRMHKLVLERNDLERKVEERTAELQKVNAIVKSINEKIGFNELMDSILKEAHIVPGIQKASILLLDGSTGVFRVRASSGWSLGELAGIELLPEECEARYVTGAREIYRDLFLVRDLAGRSGNGKITKHLIPKAMLVIRLRLEEHTEGYFVFENLDEIDAFPKRDIQLLEGLKEHFISAFLKARSVLHLEAARRAAEAAARSKSEFLANMSHELRTPMNAIIGFSTLAMKMDIPVRLRDYVNKISTSAQSLLGIINDILDFSKIEAGKLSMEAIHFELIDVLANAGDLFSMKAAEKRIELIISSAPDVPASYIGDPLRLGQVLINLLNNAIKFTSKGFVYLRVEILSWVDGRAKLEFSVRDSGIGMSPEQLSRLFQAFTQADTSTTRRYGGTGLGLTISKRLVEMMGGEILVTSEVGVGSCFHFTVEFPVADSHRATKAQVPEDMASLKVLVVDDTSVAREVLAEQLTSFHFDVSSVPSGEKAIAELEKAVPPFDLVLMDYQMPDMNGIEALQNINKSQTLAKQPSVIMVSAFGRDDVVRRAEKAGAKGFLLKPINQSLLLDTILHALGRDEAMALSTTDSQAFRGEGAVRGACVLLAEDNQINQQVAFEILSRAGVRVDIANNGLEAVSMVDRRSYDAVLMDVQMPEMDGYTATQRIREKPAHQQLPIIAMTAHALAGYREECLAVGMNDYVTKPINPDQLFSVLANWVRVKGQPMEEIAHSDDSTPINMVSLPGIDTALALRRLGGNRSLLVKLLEGFGDDYANAMNELHEHIDRSDLDAASQLLHTLRGVSGNLAAMELYQAALDLEEAIKQQELAKVRSLMPTFNNAFDKVIRSCRMLDELQARLGADLNPPPPAEFLHFEGSVLVADDNMANRMVAEALLGRHGLRVRSVDDGQAAIEMMEMEKFDAIFLDGHMPRLDGPSALAEIRRREAGPWAGRHHTIVALTGLTSPGDRKRLLDLGFDEFLPKPLDETSLQEVLRRIFRPALETVGSPGQSLWEALEGLPGGREGLLEFLAIFLQDSEDRQRRIHLAFETGDLYRLSREAHDLKSNTGTLGFMVLCELAQGLEKEAMAISREELARRLDEMDLLLEEAKQACKRYTEG